MNKYKVPWKEMDPNLLITTEATEQVLSLEMDDPVCMALTETTTATPGGTRNLEELVEHLVVHGVDVLVLEAGISANSWVHSPEAMKKALQEKVFGDKISAKVDHDSSGFTSASGTYSKFRYANKVKLPDGRMTEGIVAHRTFFPTPQIKESVVKPYAIALSDGGFADLVGPSVSATVDMRYGTYKKRPVRVVEGYSSILSVDDVFQPSAGSLAVVIEESFKAADPPLPDPPPTQTTLQEEQRSVEMEEKKMKEIVDEKLKEALAPQQKAAKERELRESITAVMETVTVNADESTDAMKTLTEALARADYGVVKITLEELLEFERAHAIKEALKNQGSATFDTTEDDAPSGSPQMVQTKIGSMSQRMAEALGRREVTHVRN